MLRGGLAREVIDSIAKDQERFMLHHSDSNLDATQPSH